MFEFRAEISSFAACKCKSDMDLNALRQKIDDLDGALLDILNQRMEIVREIGQVKRKSNAIIYRPEREKSIIDRLTEHNSGLLTKDGIEAIFLEIFAVSRNLELPEMVAYLGPEGSFTHQAAESRFGANSEYIPLGSIRSVFESVETSRSRFGVVPLENNQEGSVAETIDLLCDRDVKIVAEIPMSIHFTFATKADKPQDIETIYSKDIAFRQCKGFLQDYFGDHVKLIEVTSTSKAAKMATEQPNSAAICSRIAAKLYNLPILFDNIEDSHSNTTRFIILGRDILNGKGTVDKTTIVAKIPNTDKPGVLVDFLQEFKEAGINLTKIESRPAKIGTTFRYWFLIDFEGHHDDAHIAEILQRHRAYVKSLGSYTRLI